VAEAVGGVVVDHACRLHEGVANGGADEFEAAFFEVRAHGVGFFGADRELRLGCPLVDDGCVVGELPDVAVEGGEFFLDGEEGLGVGDGGADFTSVADDAFVLEERLDFFLVVLGDDARLEVIEGCAEVVPFFKDGEPTEARLEGVENQKLEELSPCFPCVQYNE